MRNQKVDESNALLLAALAILQDSQASSEEKAKAERSFHLARRLYEAATRSLLCQNQNQPARRIA